MSTIADLIRARLGDDHAGYVFEGSVTSWDDVVRESTRRATFLREHLDPTAKPHVGVLLENTPSICTGSARRRSPARASSASTPRDAVPSWRATCATPTAR